jgi:hypothetical protein
MRRLLVMFALLSAACGGGDGALVLDAGPAAGADAGDAGDEPLASVELGSGEAEFEATQEGQHLKLYAGTQGGHHVWLSFRVHGLAPRGVRMTLDVVPAAPAQSAHSDVMINLDPASDGSDAYEFIGWPARILDPECAVGRSVDLSLTLTDMHGVQASGSLSVIPEPPELGFTRSCMK